MKKSLIFAMAMALGVSATVFAANPFSDVPQGHWAYASVAQLAADGVITGYSDGAFKGNATMTRYEMAQIVAKALAKGAINDNDALVAEFADELDNLGVRVTNLEKKSDNVKLTGSLRYRFFSHDSEIQNDDGGTGTWDESKLRSRIAIAGAINDEWTYHALIENNKNFGHDIASDDDNTVFRRAWISGTLDDIDEFRDIRVNIGRFNYTVLDGNVFDDEIDGIKVDFVAGDYDLAIAYGRQICSESEDCANLDFFIATGMTKIGVINAQGSYFNQRGHKSLNDQVFTLGLSGDVAPDLTLSGIYLFANVDSTAGYGDGYVFGLNYKGVDKNIVGSYGLYAKYNSQTYYTYVAHTTDANTFDKADGGFKGTTLGVDYTVAENVVATVNYFDTQALKGDKTDKIIMSQLYMFF